MYHYAVNNMLKYSKDINKIYDDCLTHFSKLAIFKKSYKKNKKTVPPIHTDSTAQLRKNDLEELLYIFEYLIKRYFLYTSCKDKCYYRI